MSFDVSETEVGIVDCFDVVICSTWKKPEE